MDSQQITAVALVLAVALALALHSRTKRHPVFALALLAVLVAAWMGVGAFFSTHFLPRTYVMGNDISLLTVEEAREVVSEPAWEFRIVEDGGEWVLGAKDVGLKASPIDLDAELSAQDSQRWQEYVLGSRRNESHQIEQEVSYDVGAVDACVEALPLSEGEGRVEPQDARAELAEDGLSFVVNPGSPGSVVDVDRVSQAIVDSLDNLCDTSDNVLDERDAFEIAAEGAYVQPQVTADNASLRAAVDTANGWLSACVTYDIDGIEAAEVVDASTIAGWITIDRVDGEEVTFVPTFHQELVAGYLAKLGAKYDTVSVGKTVTCADGSQHYVVGGGRYGWVTNEAGELAQLTDDVANGRTVQRAFVTKQAGATPEPIEDGRYLEVGLADQHVWLFEDGQIVWDARAVTGSPEHPTPAGTYQIYDKERDTVLVGPDYESFVSYWMPFYGGYGLHDASGWRGDDPSNYGGSVRSYYGSHGCVNLPGPDAAFLYGKSFVGMTVYVH